LIYTRLINGLSPIPHSLFLYFFSEYKHRPIPDYPLQCRHVLQAVMLATNRERRVAHPCFDYALI